MSELEIRRIVRELCAELDARVLSPTRKVVGPAAFGVTLALTGCESNALYGVPTDVASATDVADTGAQPLYAAPNDVGAPVDTATVPVYSAPVDALSSDVHVPADVGPMPEYMAPDAS